MSTRLARLLHTAAAALLLATTALAAPPPVVSAGGIKLSGQLANLVAGTVRVDPGSYLADTYRYQHGPSDNLDELAYAADLLQLERGWPTTHPADVLLRFGIEKAAVRELGEKEFGSWIYTPFTFDPKLAQMAAARALVARDQRWGQVADGQREYLRAWLGWFAVTGAWGPARDVTARVLPGAQLLRSGPSDPLIAGLQGADYTCLTGKRSWHLDGDGWTGPIHHGPLLLAEFGYGQELPSNALTPSRLAAALRARGWSTELLSPDERARLRAASRNDAAALRWVVDSLIRDYIPQEPVHVLRTTRGVSFTMLGAPKAPTATVYHCSWIDDGSVSYAGADPGGRGGRGEQIEPGEAHVDVATRRGWAQRTQGDPIVRVDFDLVPGAVVMELLADRAKSSRPTVTIAGSPDPAPVPGTQPPPPEKPRKGTGCIGVILGPFALLGVAAALRRKRLPR